jgi:hypothetical protein
VSGVRRARLVPLGVACALTLAGCPSPGDEVPAAQLGTGEAEFAGVDDGDVLQIVQGPQGGFHLLGSVRVKGLEPGDPRDLSSPDNPTVTFAVLHDGAEVQLLQPFTQGLEAVPSSAAPWTHEQVGRFVTLDIAADDDLDGETVTVRVQVDDVRGVTVRDEVTVDLEPHPFNQ